MRKIFLFLILLILALILQIMFAGWSRKVAVDFFLILVIFWGWSNGWKEGSLTGFFSGLIKDIFFSPLLGISAFPFLLLGFFAGEVGSRIYQQNIIFFTLFVGLALLIQSSILSFWLTIFYKYSFPSTFANSLYPALVPNCIFSFGVYLVKEMIYPSR